MEPQRDANTYVQAVATVRVKGAATQLARVAATGHVVALVTVLAAVLATDPISKQYVRLCRNISFTTQPN